VAIKGRKSSRKGSSMPHGNRKRIIYWSAILQFWSRNWRNSGHGRPNVEIVAARQIIEMTEQPVEAFRRKPTPR